MRFRYRRLHDGRTLRQEMRARGHTIPSLAAATKEVDGEGRGVSQALIGFLVAGPGRSSARETVSLHSGQLIAKALHLPEDKLFDHEDRWADEASAQRTDAAHTT